MTSDYEYGMCGDVFEGELAKYGTRGCRLTPEQTVLTLIDPKQDGWADTILITEDDGDRVCLVRSYRKNPVKFVVEIS